MYSAESHWDTNACDGRPTPSYGIPQIQVPTAQMVVDSWDHAFKVTPEVLKAHPGLAIRISCAHFKWCLRVNNGDYIKATRSYNCGQRRISEGNGLISFSYFKKVLKNYELYKLN